MPIYDGDIKLLASQRMSDNTDGGGRVTGTEIVDGQSNGIFDDVNDLDRTTGNVGLRKVYPSVWTDDTDIYMGSNIIVAEPPADDNVTITLFSTQDHNDERSDARDTMERYLAPGPRFFGNLYDTQIEGQRALRMLQKETDRLPEVGEVFYLIENEGTNSEFSQYVRIADVEAELRTFVIQGYGEFDRVVVTCEITDPLRYTFEGIQPTPYDNVAPPCLIRETIVADAASYYSTRPLTSVAEFGSTQVMADSIFTQLVPAARSETALVNLTAAGESRAFVDSGQGELSFSSVFSTAPNASFYVGTGVKPGTLNISQSTNIWTDDDGEIIYNGNVVGSIDYGRGLLQFNNSSPTNTSTKTVKFEPITAPVRIADTAAVNVDPNTRGYIYVERLNPTPTPGSVRVTYMSQGKWYDLLDNGAGVLAGSESAYGSGQVDFETGDVVVTLGALPDANSEVIFSWATPVSYFNRSDLPVNPARFEFTLSEKGVAPNTMTITWDGGAKTATDDGQGALTGDATGEINYADGKVLVQPNLVPLGGSEFTFDYSWGNPESETFSAQLRNGDGSLTIPLNGTNLDPNTVWMKWNVLIEDYTAQSTNPEKWDLQPVWVDPYIIVTDDGAGNLIKVDYIDGVRTESVVGTVDYTLGEITFQPDTTVQIPWGSYNTRRMGAALNPASGEREDVYRTSFAGWVYKTAGAFHPYDESGVVQVQYRTDNAATNQIDTYSSDELKFDLTMGFAEAIQNGSVRFKYGNKIYVDRDGKVVTDIDPATGAAANVGVINYTSGEVTLTEYVPGASNTLSLESILTAITGQVVDEVVFRTPGAPLRPGSLFIQAQSVLGDTIEVTPDESGLFETGRAAGKIDYATGIVRCRFGEWVDAATVQDEDWYSPTLQNSAGKVWYSEQVYADTINYNAVVYRYLSLDPEIIGIDAIRLPSDGRVPIFRPGNICVVHHTDTVPFPIGIAGGETLDVGRTRLSYGRMEDLYGNDIPEQYYSVDLDSGIFTLAGTIDTTTYPVPWKAIHRVEDMALCSDVDLSGRLTFTKALSHDYPEGSAVSSALVMNDLGARVTNLFDQKTWQGDFIDYLVGDEPSSEYNDATYPIEVTNRGTLEQRWALVFVNSSSFNIIGEYVGQIGTGSINSDCSPINPNTGVPYFTVRAGGWGTGWATNNVLRFNTIGAAYPVWIVRTVLQSDAVGDSDSFRLQVRGNVNA